MDTLRIIIFASILVLASDACNVKCKKNDLECKQKVRKDAKKRRIAIKHLRGVWPEEFQNEIYEEADKKFGLNVGEMNQITEESDYGVIQQLRDLLDQDFRVLLNIVELIKDASSKDER